MALRSGRLTAVALAERAIDCHRRFGAKLNAYKIFDAAACLAQARIADQAFDAGLDLGPLQGIPVSVKDMYGVSGWPTYAGARTPLPDTWAREGELVKALRRQLAVIVGKTHTVEFALGGLGVNAHHGTPYNPWDAREHRVPGGSSSGAGLSLLEGSAWLAFGTDTAGSVRVPAAYTGTVGLKPARAAWPTSGIVPLSYSCDTPGILTRSAADLRAVLPGLPALAPGGRVARLDGARFGVDRRFFFDRCDPEIVARVDETLERLSRAGARLVDLELPEVWEAEALFSKGGVAGPELLASFGSELPDRRAELDPVVQQRLAEAASMTASEYVKRSRQLQRLAADAARGSAGVDALLTPATRNLPPTVAALADLATYATENMRAMGNTAPFSLFGFCAVVLPVARSSSGLPIALQLAAPAGAEQALVSLACDIEALLGDGRAILGSPAALEAARGE